MIRFLFAVVFIFFSADSMYAQVLFPDRLVGRWEGYLKIWSHGQLRDSVKVQLTVHAFDSISWQWKMEYKSIRAPMTKDYIIRLSDRQKSRFITDEGGGVVLEDYVFGDTMYSMFETGGYWLTSTQELRKNLLLFEVTAGKKSVANNGPVGNFEINSVQRAILNRCKDL